MVDGSFGGDVVLDMAAVAAAYAGLFGAVETLRRCTGVSAEVTRKAAHIGGGAIALVLPSLFDSPWPVIALALAFVGLLGGAKWIGCLASIHAVPRPTVGAYVFPVAISATFVLARGDWIAYAVGVLALTLGDSAAGLVGARWGCHWFTVWGERRSVEGSLAAFATTAAATLVILGIAGPGHGGAALVAVHVGLAVALTEAASPWGSDNLTVPLAALAALSVSGAPPYALLLEAGAAGSLALGILAPRLPPRSVSHTARAPEAARVR